MVFGYLWKGLGPAIVFQIGAVIASISLLLAFFVPREPQPGRETVLSAADERPVPAE